MAKKVDWSKYVPEQICNMDAYDDAQNDRDLDEKVSKSEFSDSKASKCCAKQLKVFVCKVCYSVYHDSCIKRMRNIYFRDSQVVQCCDDNNGIGECVIKENTTQINMLQMEIGYLKQLLVEAQDKNEILKQNSFLLEKFRSETTQKQFSVGTSIESSPQPDKITTNKNAREQTHTNRLGNKMNKTNSVVTSTRVVTDNNAWRAYADRQSNYDSLSFTSGSMNNLQNQQQKQRAKKVDWSKYFQEQDKDLNSKIDKIDLEDESINPETGSESVPDEASPAEVSLLTKIIRKVLVHNKNDIEVQRQNPNSPLQSVKSFEALNLNPNLLKGVYEMGFNAPSKIQGAALPTLLAVPSQNLIAQFQYGTGKTAAFVLAMLSKVDATKKYPQVLCLSPTYELAIQTGEVAAHMAKFCPEIEMKYAVRGEEVPRGTKLTEHILIGTPGKVLDWALKYKVFDLKKIFVFVLDEADMIAQQGHQNECIRIHEELGADCQMMFFSATYDHEVMEFAQGIVKNPIVIRLKIDDESLDNIQQYYVKCPTQESKYKALTNIYGTVGVGQAIIFCHTRKTANWLAEKMSRDGHAIAVLTGDLTVEQRINVLDRFRNGQEKVLITTNVLSRGIDVEQVTIVVNFDLPVDMNGKADCDTYLHRIGRTGRFGKHGIVINLIDSPQSMVICESIEQHFNRKIKYLNVEDSDEIEKI